MVLACCVRWRLAAVAKKDGSKNTGRIAECHEGQVARVSPSFSKGVTSEPKPQSCAGRVRMQRQQNTTDDAYLVLGVTRDAPTDEIRHAYHRLARLHHPDSAATPDTEAFNDIQRAWEQLRESDARARYDADLRAQELADAGFESRVQEVDLGDMDYAEDAAGAGVWRLDCRCGEAFVLREDDLSNGIDVLQCLSCSLCIRPLYCAQAEPDG